MAFKNSVPFLAHSVHYCTISHNLTVSFLVFLPFHFLPFCPHFLYPGPKAIERKGTRLQAYFVAIDARVKFISHRPLGL